MYIFHGNGTASQQIKDTYDMRSNITLKDGGQRSLEGHVTGLLQYYTLDQYVSTLPTCTTE